MNYYCLYHTRKGHTVGLQRSVLFCPVTAGPPQAPWARRGRWRGHAPALAAYQCFCMAYPLYSCC